MIEKAKRVRREQKMQKAEKILFTVIAMWGIYIATIGILYFKSTWN